MSRKARTVAIAAALSGLALAVAVNEASGRRFSYTNSTLRATWSQMIFNAAGLGGVSCPVTLEGSLHSRTLSKISGQLIGHITRATIAEASCLGGTLQRLAETLPWHWRYDSFTGTLPNIVTIKQQIVGVSLRVTISGIACLYKSTAARPLFFSNFLTGSLILHITVSGSLPLFSGEVVCPATLTPEGTSTTSRDAEEANISVFLVQ